jgi:hypothetical protein
LKDTFRLQRSRWRLFVRMMEGKEEHWSNRFRFQRIPVSHRNSLCPLKNRRNNNNNDARGERKPRTTTLLSLLSCSLQPIATFNRKYLTSRTFQRIFVLFLARETSSVSFTKSASYVIYIVQTLTLVSY